MFTYTVGKKNQIDSLFTHGWSRQFAGDAEGVDYGVGVYCNISYNSNETPRESVARYSRNPAENCIFKNYLEGGLDRFLIFDERFAKQVYGEHYLIKDQVYYLFPKDVADDLWSDMVRYMRMDTSPSGNGNHMRGRTAGLLQFMMSKHLRGNVANPKKYESIFARYNVRGAIYRGNADGFCMVVYNYDEIKPIAYSIDGGRTYISKKVKFTYPDVVRKLKHKYVSIDYPIAVECDGEIFYFSMVKKKNGKYNYINAKTQEEMSPVDFDSCTSINPDNGMFQVEYNGVFYDACPDGFFDNNREGHTWDELSFFEEDDIDNLNEDNKRFSKMLKNAFLSAFNSNSMKEYKKDYGLFTEILNEVKSEIGIDEFNYNGEDVYDISYFDSPDIPSIYHVTSRDSVDKIFKTGFDREFFKCCAYGDGIYAAVDIPNARHQLGSYGDSMIQIKLIGGFKQFLVFDRGLSRRFYGRELSILEQLKTFLSDEEANEAYSKCRDNIVQYSVHGGKYGVRGAIYYWGGDVIVTLPFDVSCGVPYAVSYDGGNTFVKKINKETFERFQTSIDVKWRYQHLYKYVEKAIKWRNPEGELTGYCRVKKNNGTETMIDIQTGKEIFPEADSCTTMDPNTGRFQVEYDGVFYDANVNGIYIPNELGKKEFHTWEEAFSDSSEGGEDLDDIDSLDF